MSCIDIFLWSEDDFTHSQNEWTALIERSESDKLFMSWEWLSTWWFVFSDSDYMELSMLVAKDSAGILMGIAPLYIQSSISKKIVKTKRLQLLGNCWNGPVTMRTELQDFIVDKKKSRNILLAFSDYINAMKNWDEFVFSDLKKKSQTYQVLIQERKLNNCYYRYVEENESYCLDTCGDFDDYSQSLGKNTRLKLINRRKLLEKTGKVEFIKYSTGDLESLFDVLNNLHTKRWGQAAFEGRRLEFNLVVAKLFSKKGSLRFTTLTLNGEAISIQYNYIVGKHEYNIQAGFDEAFNKKISLGYLHFGYEIESAFKQGLEIYDFLVGEGKNTQYKTRLASTTVEISSVQVIRSLFVKNIYRLYDIYRRLYSN